MRTEVMSKRPCEPHNCGLRCDVYRQSCGRNDPADRAHVNDGPEARLLHRWNDGLAREVLVPEVHGDRAVPILGSNFIDGMASVVSRVIHEYSNRPVARFNLSDGGT